MIVTFACLSYFKDQFESLNTDRNKGLFMPVLYLLNAFIFYSLDLYSPEVTFICFIFNLTLLFFAFISTKERSYITQSQVISIALLPMAFMKVSSNFFMLSISCTVMAGMIGAMAVNKVWHLVCLASTLGFLPWIIITQLYNFKTDDPRSKMIANDAALGLSVYVPILAIAYVMNQKKEKSARELKSAIDAMEKKNEQIRLYTSQLKQSLQDKDNFILFLSHETRNPLNILMGNLAILIADAKQSYPHLLDRLNRCYFCSELLLQYINNILDSGKLENHGRLDISIAPTNLKEFIMKNWKLMETMIVKKNLKAQLSITTKLPSYVKIDAQRLTQVLLNLVGNATKFTEIGSVSLHVSYLYKTHLEEEEDFNPEDMKTMELAACPIEKSDRRKKSLSSEENIESAEFSGINSILAAQEKELIRIDTLGNVWPDKFYYQSVPTSNKKGFLKLEVVDSGCGLSRQSCADLFKKFRQFGDNNQKRSAGSGLGLWISKNLCEAMQGDIRVFSKLGKGSCFTAIIEAPVADSNKISNKTKPLLSTLPSMHSDSISVAYFPKTSPNDPGKKMLRRINQPQSSIRRALIADDEIYNIEILSKILEKLDFGQVDEVANGKELIDTFLSKPENYYSLIITDVRMPGIDGIEASTKIREFEKTNGRKHIPIGFLSGHANSKSREECLGDPINAAFFQAKPVSLELLNGLLTGIGLTSNLPPIKSHEKIITDGADKVNGDVVKKNLVLCIDDDNFNLEYLKDALGHFSIHTLLSKNGDDAISELRKYRNDIRFILTDCNMPGKDGWATSSDMKKIFETEKMNSIPIYGVTGDDLMHSQEKFKQSGMDALFTKPFNIQALEYILNDFK